jgi:hypothetical protein
VPVAGIKSASQLSHGKTGNHNQQTERKSNSGKPSRIVVIIRMCIFLLDKPVFLGQKRTERPKRMKYASCVPETSPIVKGNDERIYLKHDGRRKNQKNANMEKIPGNAAQRVPRHQWFLF